MSLQASTALRNAWLDAIETEAGTAAILELRTGAQPSNCAAASTGDLVASFTLDSDWASDASSGSKAFTGLPKSDTSADNANDGSDMHFRLFKSDGTTCVLQGSVKASGGDLTLDNLTITAGQEVDFTSCTITAPGA